MHISISPKFKKSLKNTIIAINIFIISYLLLLLLTIALTGVLGILGYWLITQFPNLFTILIGAGLIASGLTILFFLVKFLFSWNKIDRSHLTEINNADHPKLFALIEEIVQKTETKFPKKVYLSHEVNAAVFYDSNFWSMFLPVEKNLIIGVGLMNASSSQEFKAILGHEFGHFSQKSMKVGSYVYQVNHIIYNMLYKNDSLDLIISKTARVHNIIAICIAGSIWIIKKIQFILQKLYNYININYMSLSREMEFHADEIAANIAGSAYLTSSLMRSDFANQALESAFNFYEQKERESLKSKNIYHEQTFIMHFLAEKNQYQLVNNLPNIGIEQFNRFNKSKLNIEDQWASHPSTEERVKALNKLNISIASPDHSPAIDLLNHKENWMESLTEKVYTEYNQVEAAKYIDINTFSSLYSSQYEKDSFDSIFNNFYTYNNPIIKEFDIYSDLADTQDLSSLFSDHYTNLTFELQALKEDLISLKFISSGEIKIKSFDYDGIKHQNADAPTLILSLEQEIKDKEESLTNHNLNIYKQFMQVAKRLNLEVKLKNAYITLKLEENNYDSKNDFYQLLNEKTQFIHVTTTYEQINRALEELLPFELKLKEELKGYLKDNNLLEDLTEETVNNLKHYCEKKLIYFHVDMYDHAMLNYLFTAIHHYAYFFSRSYFLKKKEILILKKEIMLASDASLCNI